MIKLCDFDDSIEEESDKDEEYCTSNLRNLKVIWDQCTQIYRYRTYKCPWISHWIHVVCYMAGGTHINMIKTQKIKLAM